MCKNKCANTGSSREKVPYNKAMAYLDKQVQREYQKNWMAKRRLEWITKHGPCADCGSSEKLEIHHQDPMQKVTHYVWSLREERREAELKKCIVLCKQCHHKRTVQYRREHPKPTVHGTVLAYRRGCRCEICRMHFAGVRKNFPSRAPRHILRKRGKL